MKCEACAAWDMSLKSMCNFTYKLFLKFCFILKSMLVKTTQVFSETVIEQKLTHHHTRPCLRCSETGPT